jgi:hypothetical protein
MALGTWTAKEWSLCKSHCIISIVVGIEIVVMLGLRLHYALSRPGVSSY